MIVCLRQSLHIDPSALILRYISPGGPRLLENRGGIPGTGKRRQPGVTNQQERIAKTVGVMREGAAMIRG
ncbi:MAG: hypothetical protein ACPGVU_05475, partial [Limisphaerales bacterium]